MLFSDHLKVEKEYAVLLVLAVQLGNFTPLVGGSEFVNCLLPPLENLAKTEEVYVRDKAVESLKKIAENLPTPALQEMFIPMILRLAQSDLFTSRTSSCGLFVVAYPRANPVLKGRLFKAFRSICWDDKFEVVQAAAAAFADFGRIMESDYLISELLIVLVKACSSENVIFSDLF